MILRLEGASYRYPESAAPAVGPIAATVAAGEKVLVAGPSGCGKSTLMRLAAGLLQRYGRGTVGGRVLVGDRAPGELAPSARAGWVGFASQDAAEQIVTGSVGDEIAFACESAGWEAARIEARIPEMMGLVGLEVGAGRDPRSLSGGQQQRLVIAAALSAGAPLLLLDEPLAQLDPEGAEGVLDALDALAARGTAVILAEHRVERCLPWCDRVWLLADGALSWDGRPEDLAPDVLRGLGLAVPDLLVVEEALAARGRSLRERGIDPLRWRPKKATAPASASAPPPRRPAAESDAPGPILSARGLTRRYGSIRALDGVDLDLFPGDRLAILGANGAGKSSLLAALDGESDGGSLQARGRVLAVPQDPDLSLFSETVGDELAYGPREAGLGLSEVEARVRRVAAELSLDALLDRAPHALSRGERLRVAVGAALACEPMVLILDEPTAGQDFAKVEAILQAIAVRSGEMAVVFATHDVALALRRASRAAVIEAGRLIADGTPSRVLGALPPTSALGPPPLLALCAHLGIPASTPECVAAGWT